MSWQAIVGIVMLLLGAGLFLYGANYYDFIVGWTGIALIAAGILVEIILRLREFLMNRADQKP